LNPTKIEKIETILWSRWLLLKIHCEDGTVGIGEAGVHGWQRPTETMIKTMEPYLLGKDPSKIEHHFQFLYRNSHFMGSVVNGALSAIDIALWDIKGKRLGVPIWELMGGKTRDRVRCYIHVNGDTTEELAADAAKAVENGFTAVRFAAFQDDYPSFHTYTEWADNAVERVAAVRESVNRDADLCVEIHRQMNPAESIWLGRRLEEFNPYFYEDPMLPDSPARMGDVQAQCNIPIATGERFTTIYEFQQILENKGAAYVRPDVCLVGGLSGSKKVAAMAEAQHVKVIPHNPLSPVSTAACVQLDACIPNFALQEYTGEHREPKVDLIENPIELKDGYLTVPEGPGLGIKLSEEGLKKWPFEDKYIEGATPIKQDGSVGDR
jgi:galactonate dehydratase